MPTPTTAGKTGLLAHLDALDKRVSSALFTLEPGLAVECLWSVPGVCFGSPILSLGTCAVVLAACLDDSLGNLGTPIGRLAAAVLAATAVWWAWLLRRLYTDRSFTFLNAYHLGFGKPGMILIYVGTAHLVALATRQLASDRVHRGINFYLACAFAAQVTVGVLKHLSGRVRPCAGPLAVRLRKVKRYFPQMQDMMRERSAAASFPSGDAAGGAVFAAVGVAQFAAAPASRVWWSFMLVAWLSSSGRVFFQCHHFGDVFAGSVVASGCVSLLQHVVGDGSGQPFCGWGTMAVVHLATLVLFSFLHPDKEHDKDGLH